MPPSLAEDIGLWLRTDSAFIVVVGRTQRVRTPPGSAPGALVLSVAAKNIAQSGHTATPRVNVRAGLRMGGTTMPNQADIEHLLRRTEFVARSERVAELMALPSLSAAVENILTVPLDPGTMAFSDTATSESTRGNEFSVYWLTRMVSSPRPMQERMSLFWHGHFVSSNRKVVNAAAMRDQINLFRRAGLGNFRTLAIAMSTQVAMLDYLDNYRNRNTSRNENFARELMELFILGVGNYSEADVQASSAAWTGHSIDSATQTYLWRPTWHDATRKTFLGRTINLGTDQTLHAAETINVMLSTGIVPTTATNTANRGRATKLVAAEHLSRKLWAEFAGTTPSATVVAALRDALVKANFSIKPWVTAMLLRPEFYATDVRRGLVRSPIIAAIGGLAATGVTPSTSWVYDLNDMGQRPLYPPNVSGWRTNGYWLNAAAMTARATLAGKMYSLVKSTYTTENLMRLPGGTITRQEIEVTYQYRQAELVQRLCDLMRVRLCAESMSALVAFTNSAPLYQRPDLVKLILLTPDMHIA